MGDGEQGHGRRAQGRVGAQERQQGADAQGRAAVAQRVALVVAPVERELLAVLTGPVVRRTVFEWLSRQFAQRVIVAAELRAERVCGTIAVGVEPFEVFEPLDDRPDSG